MLLQEDPEVELLLAAVDGPSERIVKHDMWWRVLLSWNPSTTEEQFVLTCPFLFKHVLALLSQLLLDG